MTVHGVSTFRDTGTRIRRLLLDSQLTLKEMDVLKGEAECLPLSQPRARRADQESLSRLGAASARAMTAPGSRGCTASDPSRKLDAAAWSLSQDPIIDCGEEHTGGVGVDHLHRRGCQLRTQLLHECLGVRGFDRCKPPGYQTQAKCGSSMTGDSPGAVPIAGPIAIDVGAAVRQLLQSIAERSDGLSGDRASEPDSCRVGAQATIAGPLAAFADGSARLLHTQTRRAAYDD